MDIFGGDLDGLGEIKCSERQPIYGSYPSYEDISTHQEILETGIKAIDFFSPIVKGGKIGLFGGAGVGKTLLLTEIIHNVIVLKKTGACLLASTRRSGPARQAKMFLYLQVLEKELGKDMNFTKLFPSKKFCLLYL